MNQSLANFVDTPSNSAIDLLLADLDRDLFIKDETGERERLVYDKIKSPGDLDFLIGVNRIHPEAAGLARFNYKLAGTINYGPLRLRAASARGESEREQMIRKLMGRFRRALNLRGKDFIWTATTEYGYGNRPHGHFLISFDEVYPSLVGSLTFPTCEAVLNSCLSDLAKETNDACLGDLVLESVSNSLGAVAYLSKEEYGRGHKAFYYSTALIPRE